MIFKCFLPVAFVLLLVVTVNPEISATQSKLPEKENFYLFLLAGQSNMAGRGTIAPEDSIPHSRVLTLNKENTWVPAIDPIHFDKAAAGVCLGRAFGIALAEANPEITIGLIPCAAGGSPVSVWQPGQEWKQTHSRPYDDAVRRTRLAMQDGILKGILWHQGESDSNEKLAPRYRAALTDLITRFRTDLGSPRVPFIIGQLGQFPSNPWGEYQQMVDTAHRRVAGDVPFAGFVSSEGLTCNSDNIHFDAQSLREFGRRYAAVYLNVSAGR